MMNYRPMAVRVTRFDAKWKVPKLDILYLVTSCAAGFGYVFYMVAQLPGRELILPA